MIVTSSAISSEVFDVTEVFDVAEVIPFCTVSKAGNVDWEVVIAAARVLLEAAVSQFVTVAVDATLQRVEVKISPDRTTAGCGVDSGQSKTIAVDVCHSVAVRIPFTCELNAGESWPSFDSMILENFSTGAWICPSAI